jgi:hypothetical protein
MIKLIIQFMNIGMAGLMAGIQSEIWLVYNQNTFSFANWLAFQQASINALNTIMPLLGLLTIILTLAAALLQKENKTIFIFLLTASGFLIIGGLITKFGNQPINKIVLTSNKDTIPADWAALSSRWQSLHIIRLLATLISFCIISFCSAKENVQTA